ncbi:nucleotidyl transferase AbiEii/AbiGii toxin family protein [Patescibacteria group bacterium]|nr:nucleotidyl transferase AbiEii/AbiGii toxin family protein [Patescibacteria group bacterium]
MLSSSQIGELVKKYKISESVVIREYLQVLFLKELYEERYGRNIFFKGGTAIRLIFGGSRFSEDLDFTVEGSRKDFDDFIKVFFEKLEKLYNFSFKDRKSLVGMRYLLSYEKVFINLDFSFREKVLEPSKSIVTSDYPVVFRSFVHHLSGREIVAEKIRALLTREKGRDIYDLWFLLSKKMQIDKKMVEEKLKYYHLGKFEPKKVIDRIKKFEREKFVVDVRPFVPIGERERLGEFFDYVVEFLESKI